MEANLKKFLSSRKNGTYLSGHASALFRIDGKLYLADPVWGDYRPYGKYWTFAPEQINCDGVLDQIEGCFLSHVHQDHWCRSILDKLKCPIFIMNGRPSFEDQLKGLQLKTFQPYQWHVHEGLEFMFVRHHFNSIDSAYFLRDPKSGFMVFHGNDCFMSIEQCLKLADEFKLVGKVHTALIPFSWVHWFPMLMKNMTDEEKKSELFRLQGQSLDQGHTFNATLKPKFAIPTGASLFYASCINNPLNAGFSSPYRFEGGLPMIAGDYLLEDGTHSEIRDEMQFELDIAKCLAANIMPTRHCIVHAGISHINAISKRVARATWRIPNYQIIINNFVIDCEDLSVRIAPYGNKPHLHFEFEPYEFRQWLEGEITLEQAIGTRRFLVTRQPNVYAPKIFDWMNLFL